MARQIKHPQNNVLYEIQQSQNEQIANLFADDPFGNNSTLYTQQQQLPSDSPKYRTKNTKITNTARDKNQQFATLLRKQDKEQIRENNRLKLIIGEQEQKIKELNLIIKCLREEKELLKSQLEKQKINATKQIGQNRNSPFNLPLFIKQNQSNSNHYNRASSNNVHSNNRSVNSHQSTGSVDSIIVRSSKQNTLPMESCAFSAVFDLLEKNYILKLLDSTNVRSMNCLINVLKGHKNANYQQTIRFIINNQTSRDKQANCILNKYGEMQDPWRILHITLKILFKDSSIPNEMPLYPILSCSCNSEDKLLIQGSPDYIKQGQDYKFRQLYCQCCQGRGEIHFLYLPNNFFIRLNGQKAKKKIFEDVNLPAFTNFVIHGIIQFNESKKHFRTLRMLGKETTIILDGVISQKITGFSERQQLIKKEGFINYIVAYQRFRGQKEVYHGEKPLQIQINQYIQGIYGS